jgi:hypothetical protein
MFVVVTAASAAAITLLWVPHVEARRDHSWTAAGERAIAAVQLPTRFHAFHSIRTGRNGTTVCGAPSCFAAPGDPRDNVDAVRQAIAQRATGRVSVSCVPDGGFAASPDKCRIVAPVDGSKVQVWLVARFAPPGFERPVGAGDFNGTLTYLVVAPRG